MLSDLDAALTELERALAGDDLSGIEGAVARLRDELAATSPDALRPVDRDAVAEMDRRLQVVEGQLLSRLADAPSDGSPASETYTIAGLRNKDR